MNLINKKISNKEVIARLGWINAKFYYQKKHHPNMIALLKMGYALEVAEKKGLVLSISKDKLNDLLFQMD